MKRKFSKTFAFFFMLGTVIVLLTAKATPASAATVAKIGSKSYSSLEKAVSAVKKGQTIKLQKNITSDTLIYLNKNTTYTLDLNQKKISVKMKDGKMTAGPSIYVQKGTVTIKNGTLNTYLQVDKKAKVTLSAVKTTKSYAGGTWYVVESGGKLTVKSGTYYGSISNSGTASIKGSKYYGSIFNSGTMTISGGTFSFGNDYNYIDNSGVIKITGGSFTSKEYLTFANYGTMTVSSGTFKRPSGSSYNSIIFNGDDSAKLTVKGGTFKNYNGEVINLYQGTVKITGGTLKAYGKSSSAVYADTGTLKITGGTIYSKKYYAVYYRERDCTYSEKNAKVSTGSDEYISVYASED